MKSGQILKAAELRKKTADELNTELLSIRDEQFKLRLQAATGQAMKPHEFTIARRNIARIKTILEEKNSAGSEK
ncbi:MAG: 50S ribosomal protein L29 [Gammaproteobacteria bacterium]|nr:50S ribosomal protein L29 [Gammaproteobacteria bacterium]NNC96592.1 50S ribosomal protein L29 [Gammaproteobacteria bacterium]NNM14817.1 50S ribosomal protein L29 [Gammaproteobacteria bacterium]